jgi:hypothetical protein
VTGEAELIEQLVAAAGRQRRIAFVLGSGVSQPDVPGVAGLLDLADRFVADRGEHPDLVEALRRARTARKPVEVYIAYRRAFADWVSAQEFDVVMQHAVLNAHDQEPTQWERLSFQRAVQLENDLRAWTLPPGLAALGALLARGPGRFNFRVFTTNFDPLIEIAIRRAGGLARSVAINRDAMIPDPRVDGITVVHLNGFWRPLTTTDDRSAMHDPRELTADRPLLTTSLAEHLREETVCLVGYGGWDDAVTDALRGLAADRSVDVLWAEHGRRVDAQPYGPGPLGSGKPVVYYEGVDSNRLFPALLRAMDSAPAPAVFAAPPRAAPGGHRVRQPMLEELIGAQRSAGELLRELDRGFGWRLEGAHRTVTPELLYWPVQLRQTNLIHTVQALVAASLSASGMRVVLCVDDLNPPAHATAFRENLVGDIRRWFGLIVGARPPLVVALSEFHEPGRVADRLLDPEQLLRPTNTWAVEHEYYRVHNLYDVLRAIRAIPDSTGADSIAARLGTTRADRLLSPPAIWAHLHHLLLTQPPETVVTLGGDEEALMWKLWQAVWPEPVRHLYSPRLSHVGHDADLFTASSFVEVRDRLDRTCEHPGWDAEGRYLHWLVHNAMLLAADLRGEPLPMVGDRPLETWDQATAAIRDPRLRDRALTAIAREVSTLFLHEPA